MRVSFKPEAEETLFEIAYFIDCINSEGAGDRWTEKFISGVSSYALPNVQYGLCSDEYLASLGLSCININDWIVAFTIEENLFEVHKIVRGSLLL